MKTYALSFNDFKDFLKKQNLNRENQRKEQLTKVSQSLRQKIITLKEFITKNLTSKKTPRALELISKIENELPSKKINRLNKLNLEIGNWILNINKKGNIDKKKKSKTKLTDAGKTIKNISLDQRINILKKQRSFQEGKCYASVAYASRRGLEMSKWHNAFINKHKSKAAFVMKNTNLCPLNIKNAYDIDNKISCLSKNIMISKGISNQDAIVHARFMLGITIAAAELRSSPPPGTVLLANCLHLSR